MKKSGLVLYTRPINLLGLLHYAKSSHEFSAEAFQCHHVHHYQCLAVPVELWWCSLRGWNGKDFSMAGVWLCEKCGVLYDSDINDFINMWLWCVVLACWQVSEDVV